MFCKHCGKQTRDNAKFCGSCGKPVTLSIPQAVVTPAPPASVPAPQPVSRILETPAFAPAPKISTMAPVVPREQEPSPKIQEAPLKRQSTPYIIGISLALIVGIAIGGISLYLSHRGAVARNSAPPAAAPAAAIPTPAVVAAIPPTESSPTAVREVPAPAPEEPQTLAALLPPPIAAAPAPSTVAPVARAPESPPPTPIAAHRAPAPEPTREPTPAAIPVQAATDSTSSMFKLGAVVQILQLAHAKDWVGVDNMAAAYRSQPSNYPPGDPKASGIQNTEGVAAFRRNDLSAAIAAFQRAARANPADPVALNNLGAVLVRAQRTEEAVDVLTELLHRAPDRATAWVNLAEATVADPDAATSALSLAFHFNQNRAKLQQDFSALANTGPDARLRAVISNVLATADAIPISH